jgi:hypothetical protein
MRPQACAETQGTLSPLFLQRSQVGHFLLFPSGIPREFRLSISPFLLTNYNETFIRKKKSMCNPCFSVPSPHTLCDWSGSCPLVPLAFALGPPEARGLGHLAIKAHHIFRPETQGSRVNCLSTKGTLRQVAPRQPLRHTLTREP